MKKMYIILLVMGCVIMSGCSNSSSLSQDDSDQTKETTENKETFTATMSEIFKKGKTMTCEFSINMESVPAQGIFYVEGKKMRYAIKASSEGMEMTNDVIVKDGYSYSRTNLDPKNGYKMKELETETDEAMGPEEREQPVNFTCKSGVPSGTFDLPKNITFKEFNYDNSDI